LAYSPASVFGGLSELDLVCLDDVELLAGQAEWEQALFHLYNELLLSKRGFVCAMHCSPSELDIQLPDLRSRLLSAPTFHLFPLSDDGKAEALVQRASNAGMNLPEEVIHYLLTRVSRDPSELFSLLDKIEEASLSQHRKVTIPFIKEELELS
jgi:DnaA family protein